MARKRKSKAKAGWLIAATHQFAELEAKTELTRQGFIADYPEYRLPRNSRGVRRTVPLFEGYVFVKETDAWWRIRSTRGVSHLLMNCERPAILADDELQFFLSQSVDEHGFYVDPVMRMIKVGDTIVPRSGRFNGVAGLLTSLDASGRTEMLFSMLGREVRTTEYRALELA